MYKMTCLTKEVVRISNPWCLRVGRKNFYAVILITEKTYQISKKRLIAYKKRCLGLAIYYKLSQSIKTMEIKLLYK